MRQAIACRLGATFALAAGSLGGSLIDVALAEAQTASACTTGPCVAAQQGRLTSLLTPFLTLPGTAAFAANYVIEGNIYQNATYAQRVQAAQNAILADAPTLIWYANNNPSPLGANVLAALANPAVMSQYAAAWAVPHTAAQPTFLKGHSAYTMYNSYGLSGPFGVPNIDPHPFQTTPVIWMNPWTAANTPCPPGTAAASCPVAVFNQTWSDDTRNATSGAFPSAHMISASTAALTFAVMMPETYKDMMHAAQQFGLSRNIIAVHYPTDIIGGRIVSYYTMAQVLANNPLFVTGDYQALLQTTATTLRGAIAGGVPTPYANCAANVAACIAGGVFPTAAQTTADNQAYVALTNYGLPATGPTNLAPVVPVNADLLIASRFPYLTASQRADVLASTELASGAPLDDGSGWARLNLYAAAGGYGAFDSNVSVTMNAALGGFNAIDLWSNNIGGTGGLTKLGTGVLVLGGNNTFSGGTTVGGGTLALTGTLTGDLTVLAGASFVTGGGYSVAVGKTLDNAGTFQSVNATLVNEGTLTNSGLFLSDITNSGTATNTSTGTITGNVFNSGTFTNNGRLNGSLSNSGTFVSGGSFALAAGQVLINNGTFQSAGPFFNQGLVSNTGAFIGNVNNGGAFANNGTVTGNFANTGLLSGNGTFIGAVASAGILSPGNSIGTISIVGSLTQNPGSTYQVEANSSGQSDRINVSGAPGTATINGGTVAVQAAFGTYAPSTTYTILNATGGVIGAYTNSFTNFPFLQASLSYDPNNVYLTLAPGGFARGAATANQGAVGGVLDRSVAGSSGDLATVLGTLSTVSLLQGQAAMDAISGQNYSGFSTANLGSGLAFMNMLGQQMSLARGGSGGGSRIALAQACDVACDGEGPGRFSIWGSGLGGGGSVAGNGNASTLTYNAGGTAAGIDYRFSPNLLAGIGVGFASGNQWLGGFSGRGSSDSYQASLYASFTQSAFYLDALAGYGFNDNTMTRQIFIPGLQPRTATGRAGANQLVGQAEAGYKLDIFAPALASLTPFARLQGISNNQAGFSESGANSLSLTVAQQTTNSLRSTFGAELAGALDVGLRDKLGLQLRLGWAHEYADVSRPVTASFAGAPGAAFTVFGAAPLRDTATLGLAASTAIAAGTSLYLRYDGEFGTGTDTHAISGGLRMVW